jgi:hypothetical protein
VSFYDNSDLPTGHFGTLRFSDAPTVNLFAYTFSFGNGFSATLAAEEGRFGGVALGSRLTAAGATVPNTVFTEAGQTMPDIVGNLKYAGTWGSAQLSGALHQLRSDDLVTVAPGVVDYPDTELGWSVSFQASLNLPALAAGDAAWLAVSYADGALGYLGFGGRTDVGSLSGYAVDGFVGEGGDIETGEGWSVAGGLRHYWTPTIRQNVFGSYARVEYGADLVPGFLPGTFVNANAFDFDEWRAGTNVIWSPVSGLDLGVEVLYANIDPRGPDPVGSDNDVWEGRLRVQRDF